MTPNVSFSLYWYWISHVTIIWLSQTSLFSLPWPWRIFSLTISRLVATLRLLQSFYLSNISPDSTERESLIIAFVARTTFIAIVYLLLIEYVLSDWISLFIQERMKDNTLNYLLENWTPDLNIAPRGLSRERDFFGKITFSYSLSSLESSRQYEIWDPQKPSRSPSCIWWQCLFPWWEIFFWSTSCGRDLM